MNKTTLNALKLAEAYIAGMKWSEEADEALAAICEVLAKPVKPLTDEMLREIQEIGEMYPDGINKVQPVKQEPVAWGNLADGVKDEHRFLTKDKAAAKKYHEQCYDLTELYAAPVQPVKQEPEHD